MYTCWHCELRQGDPDTPVEESHLCPECDRTLRWQKENNSVYESAAYTSRVYPGWPD